MFKVVFGINPAAQLTFTYAAPWHAKQFARALAANGTPFTLLNPAGEPISHK